jgi:hypothetical protein
MTDYICGISGYLPITLNLKTSNKWFLLLSDIRSLHSLFVDTPSILNPHSSKIQIEVSLSKIKIHWTCCIVGCVWGAGERLSDCACMCDVKLWKHHEDRAYSNDFSVYYLIILLLQMSNYLSVGEGEKKCWMNAWLFKPEWLGS